MPAAALTLAAGVWMATGSAWLAVAACVLAMVLTNVWNFMDGIDGLAASQAVLVAAGVALVADGPVQWLALALLAATMGFLPFNFPKARIFLGDIGSGALGYTLAMLVVVAAGRTPPGRDRWSWWPWLLPLSAFLLDAGLTLLGRMVRARGLVAAAYAACVPGMGTAVTQPCAGHACLWRVDGAGHRLAGLCCEGPRRS